MEHLKTAAPDYDGRGLLNLTSSLRTTLGEQPPVAPLLDGPDLVTLCRGKHVVLFVIDGLGYEFLRRAHAPALNQTNPGILSSVFPSTTSSAIPTFLTGLSPLEHGNVGWDLYDESLDDIVCPLPFVRRSTGKSLSEEGLEPQHWFGYQPLASQLSTKCYSVSPQAIAFSVFNRYHSGRSEIRPYGTLTEMFGTVEQVLLQTRERSFTYAYYSELDRLGHLYGMASEQVAANLAVLDIAYEQFLQSVAGSNAVILLTADHGFVDPPIDKRLFLPDYPDVKKLLKQRLCGEPRTAFCHVASATQDRFENVVRETFGDCLDLIPSVELVERGYFGPGTEHPRLRSRIGDFTLMMRDDYMLTDALAGEERVVLNGVHGGLSTAEMRVPLCIAEI